jgi:cell division protein FtsI/penicillin-binding protein 2
MRRTQRQKRIVILIMFVSVLTVSLGVRLFHIQYTMAEEFARAALIQRSLRYVYSTGRGQILDRNGQSLLDTRQEPVLLSFQPMWTEDTRQVLAQEDWDTGSVVHVIRGLNRQTILQFQQNPLPGLLIAEEEQRYGEHSLAPHVTGYVQRQETRKTRPNYVELSSTPKSGLELAFNYALSANRPKTVAAIVDGQGNLVGGLGYRHWQDDDPSRPYDVVTTLDSAVQKVVETVGSATIDSGAIVVMEPRSGGILAMASFPDVKPLDMYAGVPREQFDQLVADPRKPFINKAIQQYQPGSVFKVILAAAAIESTHINTNEIYTCIGSIEMGDDKVDCYNQTAHGDVDLTRALTVSCNAYFINLGQVLGRDTVTETARRFKLGRQTSIPLGSEASGLIPEPADIPHLGDLANASIGQGAVETTPLQLARLMAIIANDGRDIYPRLVSEIIDSRGRTVKRYPVQYGSQVISPSTAHRLKAMLADVVEYGTAQAAGSPLYTAAGKSGTAQTQPNQPSHSWFAGYATANGQTIAVTVFVEKRQPNAPRASQIFREVTEAIFAIP